MAEKELESFRRQWQDEVAARARGSIKSSSSTQPTSSRGKAKISAPVPVVESQSRLDDDHAAGWNFDNVEEQEELRRLGVSGSGVHPESQQSQEPKSALEHYERAVEREGQGKLGESLAHYRKAFRLDDNVDKKYRNKHFPPSSFAPKAPSSSANLEPLPKPSQESSGSVHDLLASFVDAPILGAPPLIERASPPPCPVANIPSEVLTEILLHTALVDISSFSRLSQVCKRFAYLTATEDQIWKRIVHGPEFGFSGMHFNYDVTLSGRSLLPDLDSTLPDLSTLSLTVDPAARTLDEVEPPRLTLPLTPTYPTYRQMHRARPRIRFAGLYISTVNYVRPGASSATTVTWDSPVHVVTYYRYLRFLRDGTVLSLLSTAEPSDVVPHFRLENVNLGQGAQVAAGGGPGIVAVAKNTLKGRWRMSPLEEMQKHNDNIDEASTEDHGEELQEPEGNVYVETKGPTPAYTYTLQLALRSAGGGTSARNTKLVWRGFWSYNLLSDDWAEFGLKNDRPFVWSRVRSWGDS